MKRLRMCVIASVLMLCLCAAPVLSYAADMVVAQSALTLYESADGQSKVVGTIPAGTRMTMSSISGSWCQVQSGGVSGWCSSGLVSKVAASTGTRIKVKTDTSSAGTPSAAGGVSLSGNSSAVSGTPAANPAVQQVPAGYGVCTTASLNVRQAPDLNAPIVGRLVSGSRVRLLSLENGWYQIQLNGSLAWVKAEYISAGTARQTAAEYQPITGTSDYLIWINIANQVGAVLKKDDSGNYTSLVRTFGVSTGLYDATPTGIFHISEVYRWKYMHENCYTQYAMRVYKGIMLHSEPYSSPSGNKMAVGGYNKLGSPASEGCIRMRVVDIKWLYENCGVNTTVQIVSSGSIAGVPSAITYQQLPYTVTWDPTDPDPNNPYYGQYNETYIVQ